jgi:hypothetical protein
MKKSNFALRLSPSLMEEARKLAKAEGIAINQLINVAVAEKVSALRTEEYFAARAARGNVNEALTILRRAGVGQPPLRGDELSAPPPATAARDAIDQQLRFAIANKRLIQVSYGKTLRVAEPHDYGVHKGVARLLIYQRGGTRAKERSAIRGWRLLDVAKIGACLVLAETFSGGRGALHRRHHVWDVVFARVA